MKNIYRILFTLLLLVPFISRSQSTSFIPGLPSKTIFDLHIDKLGYLWIASDLGVFRYDGIDFKSFSHTEQRSLRAIRLIEDPQGKIWFQNAAGQLFFIKNGKTAILKSYNPEKESALPSIALYKDLLIASSDSGLFLCNTLNLSGRYVKSANSGGSATRSVAVIRDKVIAYGDDNWYIYQPGKSLRRLGFSKGKLTEQPALRLKSITNSDTALLYNRNGNRLSKIGIQGDSLVLFDTITSADLINSISELNGKIWVNTLKESWSLNGKQKFSGSNVRDMAADQEGNIWYADRTNGLMVYYNQTPQPTIVLPSSDRQDVVQSVRKHGKLLLLGTLHGKVHVYDSKLKRFVKTNILPSNTGSVTSINVLEGEKSLIGTSVNTYLLDLRTYILKELPEIKNLRQTDQDREMLFATSPNGLYIVLKEKSTALKNKVINRFKQISDYHEDGNYFLYKTPSNAICYDPGRQSLFVMFRNGLHMIDQKGISPVLYNGKPLYCSSLISHHGKVLMGTLQHGLLIYHQGKFEKIGIPQGLLSETILEMKKENSKLWLVNPETVQLLDLNNYSISSASNFYGSSQARVLDIEQVDDEIYAATSLGLHAIPLTTLFPKGFNKLALSLDLTGQAEKDKTRNNNYNNDVQFAFSIPLHYGAKETRIKYSLMSENDTIWKVSEPGQRNLRFTSLNAGKYTLTASAFNSLSGRISEPVVYHFNVLNSVWNGDLAKHIVIATLVCFSLYILVNHYRNKRNFKKILDNQQQTVRNERQRISSEIHDDIGAGLFALKLYVDVSSKSGEGIEKMKHIGLMINDMSDVIKEIIWSTNYENDNLENLIYYIQFQSTKLFEHSDIVFQSSIPEDIPSVNVSSDNRKNVYLIVKEFIHNSIKHSMATHVFLNISTTDQFLYLTIQDNGIGYDESNVKLNTMGLRNVRLRIERVRGTLKMASNRQGTNIFIEIPLK